MKKIVFFIYSLFFCNLLYGQSAGDFRSAATGNWTTNTTWERFDGSTWSTPGAGVYPTNANGVITIRNSHDVTVDDVISIDETVIENGGTITVDLELNGAELIVSDGTGTDLNINSGGTLILSDDGFGFDGSLVNVNGQLVNSGTITIDPNISTLNFNAGSEYEHAQDGSEIPLAASWDNTSTVRITGVITTMPGNIDQFFGNFIWNCAGQSSAINIGMTSNNTIINGDMTIDDTNGNLVYFSETAGTTVTIKGDFIVSGSARFSITSTVSTVTADVSGNYNNTSSGISSLATTGTGILNIKGNVIQSNGELQGNANSAFNFNGTGLQTFTGGSTFTDVNFIVKAGAELDMGTSALTGGGDFTLESGAILKSGSTEGIESSGTGGGNIQVTGTRTFTDGAKIIFNASGAQNMGDDLGIYSGLDIEVNNTDGLSMESNLTISSGRTLTLASGTLSVGSNTLILNGSISGTGTLITGTTSNLDIGGSGSLGTLNFESGTGDVNNFILNRTSSGTATLGGDLNIHGTFTHTDGDLYFADQSFHIMGDYSRTSGELIPNANSTLIISGTGTIDQLALGGGPPSSIGTLTLNNSNGFSTNSGVSIATSLDLLAGTLGGTGSFTMGSGSTITRSAGEVNINSISATTSYNVIYSGSGNITVGMELPTGTSQLNDLTIDNSATVSLSTNPVTVNGTLTLSDGTFDPGSNDITLNGDLVSNAAGNFSNNTLIFAGTTNLSGSVDLTLTDIEINSSSTLNLGSVNISFNGTGNIDNLGTVEGGTSNVEFAGTSTTITGGGSLSFNNVVVSGEVTFPNSNVNITGNWTISSSNFLPGTGTVTFTGADQDITMPNHAFYNLVLAGTGTKTLQGPLDVNNDLTINSSLDISSNNYRIKLGGDFTNNGTFVQQAGTVELDGNNTQQVKGTSKTVFHNIDLTLNQSTPGLQIEVDADLEGILTLSDNTIFDPDGSGNTAVFTLLSASADITTDASIAPIPSTADITGTLNVQRFLSDEGTVNRFISSPVDGATVADWQNSFPVKGPFTGSDDAGADNTLFYYDETPTGDHMDNGWTAYPVSTNTEPLTPTTGYKAEMNGQVTIDIGGDITGGVNMGDVDFGVTFTSTPSPPDDGWNLVGNPYPSAIDWGNANWTLSNVLPSIHTWDAGNGVYTTYNKTTSQSINGGSRYIGSSQAFWIQTDGASPTMTASENVKVSSFPADPAPSNYIRIALEQGILSDETVVHFIDPAAANFDRDYDSRKRFNEIFSIYSPSDDGQDLAINAQPSISCDVMIPLKVSNADPGTYNIVFSEFASFDNDFKIYLIDNKIDSTFDVKVNLNYEFDLPDNQQDSLDLANGNRFSLHFAASGVDTGLDITYDNLVCEKDTAIVTVISPQSGYDYQVFAESVAVSEKLASTGSDLELPVPADNLQTGPNTLTVKSFKAGCPGIALTEQAETERVDLPEITAVTDGEGCAGDSITLSATSELSNGTYRWYDSQEATVPVEETTDGNFTTPELTETTEFYVTAVSPEGCESSSRDTVTAVISDLPTPVAETDSAQGCTGDRLTLTASGAPSGGYYNWYENESDVQPISGENSDSFTTPELTSSRTYYVTTINADGCESDEKTPALAEILSVPDASVSTAEICSGESATVVASGAPSDGSYNWYENQNDSIPIPDESDSVLVTPELNTSVSYFVAAVNHLGCESETRAEAMINVIPIPDINVEGDTACIGDSLVLSATGLETGGQYHLYIDDTLANPAMTNQEGVFQIDSAVATASYYISGENQEGCRTELIPVDVVVEPDHEVMVVSDTSFCEGDSLLLEVTSSGENVSFNWYENDSLIHTGNTFTVTASRILIVESVNRLGCINPDKKTIESLEIILDQPETPILNEENNALSISLDADLYIWYRNNEEIDSTSESSYQIDTYGNYSVAYRKYGCLSPVSNSIDVSFVNALSNENILNNISVYPNPVSDELILEYEGINGKTDFFITNLKGQSVGSGSLPSINQDGLIRIDVRNLENGLYIIHLTNDELIKIIKFVKE